MSNVISLFGNTAPKEEVSQPDVATEDARQESQISEQPAKAPEPKSPVYVRVRADVFQDMLNTLEFYARQGWDTGSRARKVLTDTFSDEPA